MSEISDLDRSLISGLRAFLRGTMVGQQHGATRRGDPVVSGAGSNDWNGSSGDPCLNEDSKRFKGKDRARQLEHTAYPDPMWPLTTASLGLGLLAQPLG